MLLVNRYDGKTEVIKTMRNNLLGWIRARIQGPPQDHPRDTANEQDV